MGRQEELLDAVNEATNQQEHDSALAFLRGWRQGVEDAGCDWSGISADMHSMAKYGEERPMCCGVLLDWKPKDAPEGFE